ncbi:MAG: hypothetical protein ACOX47_00325 [Bacillota bacterium]|jgi:hypothetical protein
MNKYAKVLLVLFIFGAIFAILFRPSGKIMSRDEDSTYLALYEESINNNKPLFIEFYGRY